MNCLERTLKWEYSMNTLDQDARAEVNMDDLIIFPHTIPLYCPIAEKNTIFKQPKNL